MKMKKWSKIDNDNYSCPKIGVISRNGLFNFWRTDQSGNKWVLCLLKQGLFGPYSTLDSAKRAARKRV